jgi:hypothetical protein
MEGAEKLSRVLHMNSSVGYNEAQQDAAFGPEGKKHILSGNSLFFFGGGG